MSSSTSTPSAKVVPAQLSYLAIYNPTLGSNREDADADEQILYFFSREQRENRKSGGSDKAKRTGQKDDGKRKVGEENDDGREEEDHGEEDERFWKNQRLRQVGLARGMVEFANNFSNGVPVDSIETEKSRIVLQQLETNWWVLASINLTQLPVTRTLSQSQDKRSGSPGEPAAPMVEYSSREVSPPQLLLKQLTQANSIFLLHHATSLDKLYQKLGKDAFCAILGRFWDRFINQWDVLLHGNPAAEIYDCIKLAGGGELGVGVGEEEWGSGEREVLEGFVERTEGLVDLMVGRYGDAPVEEFPKDVVHEKNKTSSDQNQDQRHQQEPWLGKGEDPRASDGIIFSGIGTVSRKSIATVSQWMDAIFKHGEDAYGVGDNPASRPRHRRKQKQVIEALPARTNRKSHRSRPHQQDETPPRIHSPRGRPPDLRRRAIENNAPPPGIPAPLVGAVERSLDEAVAKAASRSTSRSPRQEKSEDESMKNSQDDQDSSFFGTDKMMKYLSLGYGSSWTLNPKGFGQKRDESTTSKSSMGSASSNPMAADQSNPIPATTTEPLDELDPTPEVSDEEESPFVQRLEQSIGKFLIGLSGDLENTEFEPDPDLEATSTFPTQDRKAQRIFLRTLNLRLAKPRTRRNSALSVGSRGSRRSFEGHASRDEVEENPTSEGKTSAASSVDGPDPFVTQTQPAAKLQVAVYVHQPFIFVFLFELHTSVLSISSFYRGIHHQLGPLQKPLLRSTDPSRVLQRVAELVGVGGDKNITDEGNINKKTQQQQTIYDLVHDPVSLTVRTSLPNIPIPGSLAAEGLSSKPSSITVSGSWYTLGIPIGSMTGSGSGTSTPDNGNPRSRLVKSEWTRIEALNVHTQMLNTWVATRDKGEIERLVKTGRGWWVLWMLVADSEPGSGSRRHLVNLMDEGVGTNKEAFLVRKAGDAAGAGVSGSGRESKGAIGGSSGRWLLRDQTKESSAGDGSGSGMGATTTTKGVVEGVGVDARKWVDGLLRLSQ